MTHLRGSLLLCSRCATVAGGSVHTDATKEVINMCIEDRNSDVPGFFSGLEMERCFELYVSLLLPGTCPSNEMLEELHQKYRALPRVKPGDEVWHEPLCFKLPIDPEYQNS
ncbi:MAG: hypothetical protein COV07_04390 [Candidatus Vogelbacteria bacterium CG10_big_fil_rev_8_21_14_0_10_45_14]|uniref:Uncharacterized protein n=1 Tax=Candidatus Vogelbacteria bacterium CG10_big_fil_rev_8_21_14_0_10_45_14 TaxID=1975042 RepID=A0A2H0RIM0_9BACT|nr:MAG: hypothetical protein COV07_04390 [Candidatus Vogelbacteria bacterium CG10_big_fil_rev_8_21_14_0_10_45_14]